MPRTKYIYIWEGGECPTCSDMTGATFDNEDDIDPIPPLHPNCGCYISTLEVDGDGNIKPTNEKFHQAVAKTMKSEGGDTPNVGRLDQPTNMGIKQGSLNAYNAEHPAFNFPDNREDLTSEQAAQIYKMDYWDQGRFNDIDNDRIRDAAFDMTVMSGAGRSASQIQESLNNFGANVDTDGVMGSQTINALNSIPDNQVNDFMDTLKSDRMDHLQNDSPQRWEKNKNGWTERTGKY